MCKQNQISGITTPCSVYSYRSFQHNDPVCQVQLQRGHFIFIELLWDHVWLNKLSSENDVRRKNLEDMKSTNGDWESRIVKCNRIHHI